MPSNLFRAGAILGFLAVALGAFGTHGLKDRLAPDMMEVWKTGTQYQLIHAVMICVCGALCLRERVKGALLAGWLFVGGVVVFSGSLYVLALTGIRILGAVTPLGGLAMLAGWVVLAVNAGSFFSASAKLGD